MLSRAFVTAAWILAASSAVADSKPIDVSVQQLVAAPQQFNGKRVSVSGYFDTTETHACDLRATKKRPDDNRQLINIEVPPGTDDTLRRLTHNFTKVVRARIVGTFQYKYVGPIKETPVHGDRHVQKIVTMQVGYGWEGLWDKQITRISDFRVFAR
jgi:hypothetical protein